MIMIIIRIDIIVHWWGQCHIITAIRLHIRHVQFLRNDRIVRGIQHGVTYFRYRHLHQRIVQQLGERVMATAHPQGTIYGIGSLQMWHPSCQHRIRISDTIGQRGMLWHSKGVRGTTLVTVLWSVMGIRIRVIVQLVQVLRLGTHLLMWVSVVEGILMAAIITSRKWHRAAMWIVPHRMVVH